MWTRVNEIDRMFGAMDLLRSNMNKMFGEYGRSFGEESGWRTVNGTPRTNLYDNGDSIQVVAELAGLSKDDINVRIQGNYLEISGTRKNDAPEGYKAHRIERDAASFTRSFTLPSDVDAEKIEATLKDGLLTLNLPKAEAAKPKQISIN